MNQTQIREATAADLPALLAFEQGVVKAERPYDGSIKTGSVHYYDIAELVAQSESLVVVAENSGQLVGTGHATLKRSLEHMRFGFRAHLLEMIYATKACCPDH